MKQEIKNQWQSWIFFLSIGIILIIIYKALDSMGYLLEGIRNFFTNLSPFLAGLFMAYLLFIPERKIEKAYRTSKVKFLKKNCRKFGIITTYLTVFLIILIIINVILPVLMTSVNELISNFQNYYSKIIESYNKLPNDSIFKTEQVYTLIKQLQNIDFGQYVSLEKITSYLRSVVGAARGLFDIFVTFIVSVYILAERNEILQFFKKLGKVLLKEKTYNYIEKYFYKANGIFFKFISSQFIDSVLVGIIITIAMQIMKIKYASLLGFTIGLFNMIPYFGAIIAVVIAGLITVITSGISKTLLMLVVIILLQQIDANIINPKIVGDSLKISPLLVIFAVTLGGAYFGVIGMFLFVPIAAVMKILVNDYIDNKLEV